MNHLRRLQLLSTKCRSLRFASTDIYEPDYLDLMKPKIPLYNAINVQISGYDYVILESYQKLINKLAKAMELNVEDGWAVPAQHLQITTYKPNSELINSQYLLKNYERTLQITEMNSLQLPNLIRALEASLPAGVKLNIVNHEEYHEEARYIPDKDLLDMKQTLEDLGGPKKK